jgi:ArsR family transcriptional regulator
MRQMKFLLSALKVLAEPTRLRILILLREESLTVTELQDILQMGQSRISTHLSLLKREGLVTDRRSGKSRLYSVEALPQALVGLIKEAARELPEAAKDQAGLRMVLRKRKDKATEYFNRLAGKFGRTYIPGRSWRALAHGLLRLLPPMIIADLGAGEGTLSQLLARRARRVIAIDNSERMVEFGRKLAEENGISNLEYRLGDLEATGLRASSVDLALFSQALHHAASPQRALDEAMRILRPGGKVLILDLAAHSFEQARELYAHVWLGFSEVELFQMLERSGFEEIEVSIVSTEKAAPHFRTILALGKKPGG